MTARDVTGFHALVTARESGDFSPHFGAISLLNCADDMKEKENNHWRKLTKSSGDGPRNR